MTDTIHFFQHMDTGDEILQSAGHDGVNCVDGLCSFRHLDMVVTQGIGRIGDKTTFNGGPGGHGNQNDGFVLGLPQRISRTHQAGAAANEHGFQLFGIRKITVANQLQQILLIMPGAVDADIGHGPHRRVHGWLNIGI